ncbi:tyrosine-type recombinase/integrase [Micavibrio aeruginosavorus]|uniref:Phage integrase family protein n=1 Tax=Micavibrio aeruginosavorus (strain ARL-13) TaxID=856793 RepID=G2KSU6_MICAA|nr:site-specific integrase [Micavibrio aeruginosavorus]AEP10091.1 phage integrase family protein [Micavibrio aeruginosavorus ARL-13]
MAESAKHTLMGGKLHVYKRENSDVWQCSTYLGGKNRRISTKETSLAKAKDFAEDWYLELFGKHRRGEIKDEKTFKHAADQFLREYEIITEGHRNKEYVKGHSRRLKAHLIPFFGEMGLSEITAGQLQEYRIHRLEKSTERWGRPPARNTIHQEIVTLRQTLKVALRHNWLDHLPDFSEPYRSSGKISHRAWFSPEEYKTLYEATRARAKSPLRKRYKWESEQLHDYVLFMANTGLRPDEAMRLEYRDVVIVDDVATGETILEISVRGKRGVGYCKSMPGAVKPFERLVKRNNPQKTDVLFPKTHRQLFNTILDELSLKFDREGNRRTAYSLRHTYICMRLMEGADIYQIAKNCRTSVEMIEKYYASHIKNMLDASAINVRRSKTGKQAEKDFQSILDEDGQSI